MSRKTTFDLRWYGGLAIARERKATARGLGRAADHLRDKAVEITPVENLDLVNSGTSSLDQKALKAAVSFGAGLDEEYTVRQHEDLDLQHDAGKSSKFLERPFNSERGEMQRIIAAELGRELS